MSELNGEEFEGSFRDEADFDPDDIFAPAGPKAFNWTEKGQKGLDYTFHVLTKPELVQGWDDVNKRPAIWPDSGNPKMNGVMQVEYAGDGETYSLWMTKPSALWRAVQTASREAGASIRPGGTLTVSYGGLGKRERGQRSAPHEFPKAVYIPES